MALADAIAGGIATRLGGTLVVETTAEGPESLIDRLAKSRSTANQEVTM